MKEHTDYAVLVHLPSPYAAALLGVILSAVILVIYPPAGEQNTIAGRLTGEPVWIPEIAAGLWLGYFVYRRVPSRLAFFTWLTPAFFLFFSALSWQRGMAQYDSTFDTYFGTGCGGSECLYELFLTMPFYTSVGYTLGALLAKITRSRLPLLS